MYSICKQIGYCLAPLTALASGAVYAQDAVIPTPTEAGARRLEEITVAAQRRSESLQRVQISVTALTTLQLQNAGIVNVQDLTRVTPGQTLGNFRNSVTPYLRGIGTKSGTAGAEGAIARYVDGVYHQSPTASISVNNIERMEVLEGPQGTLFGCNATGGPSTSGGGSQWT